MLTDVFFSICELINIAKDAVRQMRQPQEP